MDEATQRWASVERQADWFRASRREGRAAGLEEAAKYLEWRASIAALSKMDFVVARLREEAVAIRKLIETEPS